MSSANLDLNFSSGSISVEPVRRTTTISQLEAIAANLDVPQIDHSRLLVEWLIENPEPARRPRLRPRLGGEQDDTEQSLMLKMLPDDVLELVLDEFEDRTQLRTTDLMTNWSRPEERRLAARSATLEALSLVCRRLSQLALPRLRREMWYELKNQERKLVGQDVFTSRALVWIKGIEHSQARQSIKHLCLYDYPDAEPPGTTTLISPAELGVLLNILSDNLQILVLKGSAVRALFHAVESEPLTKNHVLHTLKIHLQQPVGLDWLLLCGQRFGLLDRLACAFERLAPSVRLGAPEDELGWSPAVAVELPMRQLSGLELNLARWEDSVTGLTQLIELDCRSLEMLVLRGKLTLKELAHPLAHGLGTLVARTSLKKLCVALELVADQTYHRQHALGPLTTLWFLHNLLETRLPQLQTLALTLLAAVPKATQPFPEVPVCIPLLYDLWTCPLVGSPHLTTLIVRTIAKASQITPVEFDLPAKLVPQTNAPFRKLAIHLDIPDPRALARRMFTNPDELVNQANQRTRQHARLRDWCRARPMTKWIEFDTVGFKSDAIDLFRYF